MIMHGVKDCLLKTSLKKEKADALGICRIVLFRKVCYLKIQKNGESTLIIILDGVKFVNGLIQKSAYFSKFLCLH